MDVLKTGGGERGFEKLPWVGVPKGSILGPLIFHLYTNDTVKDINSSIRLFADTSLYIIALTPHSGC